MQGFICDACGKTCEVEDTRTEDPPNSWYGLWHLGKGRVVCSAACLIAVVQRDIKAETDATLAAGPDPRD